MRYYEHCLAQQNALTSDFYHYVYVLEPYVETALKNQTNTNVIKLRICRGDTFAQYP